MEYRYVRKVNYYETDQMGIVHHSNYIRWFEEARIYFLEQIGLPYEKIESMGIISPVLSVNCEYKISVKFGEQVVIIPKLTSFNGFKFTISYEVRGLNDNQLKCIGTSSHCMLDTSFRPVNTKKNNTEIYRIFNNAVCSE